MTAVDVSGWMDVPPVFIVGSYRSGTSLLRLMLSAHPGVWISGEGAYIYGLRSKFHAGENFSDPATLEALHEYIVPFLRDEQWIGIPAIDDLRQWTAQHGASVRSLIAFYNTWDARGLGKANLRWWGDNAPYHVFNIPYFDELYPRSKYIHMIRDPRDVYTSIKFNYKEAYPLQSVLTAWQRSIFNGLLAERFIGPARFMTLAYEALVTEPEVHLRRTCEFLEIPYDEQMLAYHESTAALALSQLVQHTNVVKPVFASSVGKFRRMLTTEEIAEANDRFTAHLRCLGYLSQDEYDHIVRTSE